MDKNNTVTAIQIGSVSEFYGEWLKIYDGSQSDFYHFMTTPTIEREYFMAKYRSRIASNFIEGVVSVTLK